MSTSLERAFVYVANAESRELLVFEMALRNGALTLVSHVLGGKFTTLAHTPDQRFLFAGLRDEPFGIASFAVDSERGRLNQIGETRMPGPLAYLSIDRSGRWLFAASYHKDFVAVCEISADGDLREPHQVIAGISKAHSIEPAPSNAFVLAASLGSDTILTWPFDAPTGRLIEDGVRRVETASGAGPRHIRFHPFGNRIYVICELDASVRSFDYDSDNGHLSERSSVSVMPKGARDKRWAAELRLTPDGRFMYASERSTSTLAAFSLDESEAEIESRGSVPTEKQPRAFAVDPSGQFLFAVGQKSNRLSSYSIDPETGLVTKLNEYQVGSDPCWVEVLGF
jgi:6-phosphogluconolactonase